MPISKRLIIGRKKTENFYINAIIKLLKESELAFTKDEIIEKLFSAHPLEIIKGIKGYISVTGLTSEGVLSHTENGETYYYM